MTSRWAANKLFSSPSPSFVLRWIANTNRYEVESDENRRNMVIEIGRRFLGLDEDIKDQEEKSEKTELNNLNQNNVSSPKNNQINDKTEGQPPLTESDLVIDILNDELISQVRQKIQSERRMNARRVEFVN